MEAETSSRSMWIHVRLTPVEYKILYGKYKKTTCRSLSQFVRAVLLDKPLVATYRNASQDDLLQAMATLTQELSAIGNNVNQSVKKLHTLREGEAAGWAVRHASESEQLLLKINEAKALLNSMAERWLR